MNNGSCLCGDIQFQVTKMAPLVGHCHCNMCQKFHGAAFSTFGEAKREHLVWLNGEALLAHYHAENGTVRSFCSRCGSSLLFESTYNREQHTVEIALAAFDSLAPITPDAHIYMATKVPWFSPNDDLPKYQGYREG